MRIRDLRNRCFGIMAAVLLVTLHSTSWTQQIAIMAYSVPIANSYPYGITVGPDGALWFSQVFSIGSITTAGAITEYTRPAAIPRVSSQPARMVRFGLREAIPTTSAGSLRGRWQHEVSTYFSSPPNAGSFNSLPNSPSPQPKAKRA